MFSKDPPPSHIPENFHVGRCPDCKGLVAVLPSIFIGEISCPSCKQSLWFLQAADLIKFFADAHTLELKERVIQFWEDKLELSRERIVNRPDSFDISGDESLSKVETIMEFEEEFGDDLIIGEDDVTL